MDFFTFSPVWCDLSRNLFVKLYGFLYSFDKKGVFDLFRPKRRRKDWEKNNSIRDAFIWKKKAGILRKKDANFLILRRLYLVCFRQTICTIKNGCHPKGKGMAAEAIHEKSFAVCGTAEDLVYPDGIISSLPWWLPQWLWRLLRFFRQACRNSSCGSSFHGRRWGRRSRRERRQLSFPDIAAPFYECRYIRAVLPMWTDRRRDV